VKEKNFLAHCSSVWKSLSKDEQDYYTQRAAEENEGIYTPKRTLSSISNGKDEVEGDEGDKAEEEDEGELEIEEGDGEGEAEGDEEEDEGELEIEEGDGEGVTDDDVD